MRKLPAALARLLRLSSGATIAALIFGNPNAVQGSAMVRPLVQSTLAGSRRESLFAPLVLTPSESDDTIVVGHRSHSSHSSHRSHSSGSYHRSHASHYSAQSGRSYGGGSSYSTAPSQFYGPTPSNDPSTDRRPTTPPSNSPKFKETPPPTTPAVGPEKPTPTVAPAPKPKTTEERFIVVSFEQQLGGVQLATIRDSVKDTDFTVALFDCFEGLIVTSIDLKNQCVILRGKGNSSYVLKPQP